WSAWRTRRARTCPGRSTPAAEPGSSWPWSPATTRRPPPPSPPRSGCAGPTSRSCGATTCPRTTTPSASCSTRTASWSPGSRPRRSCASPAPPPGPRRRHDRRRGERRAALHEADIGVAMGRSGTDVAREAADLVLLDDHFASIVNGIEHGRATFLNIRRFLTYHLTDNVAEVTPFLVWALRGGRVPLALGLLQILALDLGTDTPSAVALGAEPPSRGVLGRPPERGGLPDATVARRAFGRIGALVALFTMAAFLVSFLSGGWRPGETFPGGHVAMAASGAAFMAVVLGQTANAFACRSTTRWPGALGWTTNPLLLVAASIELCFSLVVLFVGPIADELGHADPPLAGWLVGFAAPVAVLAVDALAKSRARRAAAARRAGGAGRIGA